MLHILLLALCSAGYLLMVLCCLYKRDSAALSARLRTERIMATLDMEDCQDDAAQSDDASLASERCACPNRTANL